jgi:hypothetical protein
MLVVSARESFKDTSMSGAAMPIRTVVDSDAEYYLIAFDERGNERNESDGALLSDRVKDRARGASDIFLMSHGWKGDLPAAIAQYDKWIGAVMDLNPHRERALPQAPFTPLIIGLHWPSLPWGDESLPTSESTSLLSLADDLEATVDACARHIADTPKARLAIRKVLQAARSGTCAGLLTPELVEAYRVVFVESGLGAQGVGGPPGEDQDGFDPDIIIRDAQEQTAVGESPTLLGGQETLRDKLLMPLRQLSFWTMKDRARRIGESAGHRLISELQAVAPSARLHLMGHSFGCIVVSAAVAAEPLLRHPIHTLFLVQGALSLWSYAADIPYAPGTAGYFHRIVQRNLVSGIILTTRSAHDTAVKRFYPRGAQLRQQFVLGEKLPKYGGIGTFGIQGVRGIEDLRAGPSGFAYDFHAGRIYNLEASEIICNGSGASGAHSDIAHPEVAHAFWVAVLTAEDALRGGDTHVGGPGLLGPLNAPVEQQPADVRSATASAPRPQRWINVEIQGRPRDEPLEKGSWYALAFDVDVVQRSTAAAASVFREENLFTKDEQEVTVIVQLDSDDFEVSHRTRSLRIPARGRSLRPAYFNIYPLHDGPSILKATVHKDGNFIQEIQITFEVGAAKPTSAEISTRGRAPGAAEVVRPRDIGFSISPGTGSYDCVLWGSVARRARLHLTTAHLASLADTARRELLKVVMHVDAAGQYVFQRALDIPRSDSNAALRIMARAGATLFNSLFFGPGAAPDSKLIGDVLRKSVGSSRGPLKLQIVAEAAPVPWGLLYIGDASQNATLDWNNFIGMRCIVEQIPLQNSLATIDSAIPSAPQLTVSLNLNRTIDAQMRATFVSEQQAYWEKACGTRKAVKVVSRTKKEELLRALADGATSDQIVYLYCHAESADLASPGGPGDARIFLSDDSVRLGDLALDAPTQTQLAGNPLIFINACESAELSPSFYDGFVPYFMAKGARGVVGTECRMPAAFAVEWARRFFDRFLNGEALGQAFLELRREFLDRHGNPLGLLYAMHCDGDTQIHPAAA